MGESSQIDRAKMRRAIEREIDERARAQFKASAADNYAELERARIRAGLPRLPKASPIQPYLQKLGGFFRFKENAQVLDIVRESICHKMIKNATRLLKAQPQNEERKIRLELIYAVTTEIEDRVLGAQRDNYGFQAEKLEKKQAAVFERSMIAKAAMERAEKAVLAKEAIAKSSDWSVVGDVKLALNREIFEPLEKQILELEKLNAEMETMIVGLPAVDPEALSAKELLILANSVEVAINYFFSARQVTTAALQNLTEAAQKSVEQIALWQERKAAAEKSETEKQIETCVQFIDGFEECLAQQETAVYKVKTYLQDQDARILRLARAKQFIQEKLRPPQS